MARNDIARLRALCGAKGYAVEKSLGGERYRLIRLDIGHAVMNPARQVLVFSMREAVVWLKHVEADEEG
jgi:hypothetical protein